MFALTLCIVVLFAFCSQTAAELGTVLHVKDTKSYQELMDSSRVALVGFYDSSNEQSSAEFHNLLEELLPKLDVHGVMPAKIDCNASSMKKICKASAAGGLRTMPGFGVCVDRPKLNPYKKKNHRNIVYFDGNVPDVNSLERRLIAKNYPSDVEKISELPSKDGTKIIYISQKETTPLFLKTIDYAYPGLQVLQLTMDELDNDTIDGLGMTKENVPKLPIIGLISNEKFDMYSSSENNPLLKDRKGVISFISGLTGLEAEVAEEKKEDVANDQEDSKDELVINAKDLDDSKIDSSSAWILRIFHDDSDIDKSSWKKVQNLAEGLVKSLSVKCSKDDSASICEKTTPFVAIVPHGSGSLSKASYRETSDTAGIKKVALGSLPEVATISEQEMEGFLITNNDAKTISILVLGNAQDPPILLRNVQLAADKYAKIAYIAEPSTAFIQNLGNAPKLPAIVAIHPIPANEDPSAPAGGQALTLYDQAMFGKVNFRSLTAFIGYVHSRSGMTSEGDDGRANVDINTDLKASEQEDVILIQNEQDWEENCLSYSGICAVGVVNGFEDEKMNLLKKTISRVGGAFRVVAIDGKCQQSLSLRFDVSIDTIPRLVAYSPKKGRFATMVGILDEDSMVDFLKGVLKGKQATLSIPQRPEFSEECEYVEEIATENDSVEDAEDFLKEIMAEEALKKKQLQKELAEEKKKEKAARLAAEAEAAKKPMRKIKRKKGAAKKTEL